MPAGRKPFTPTPEQRMQVSIMAACGFQHEAICQKIINPQTKRAVDPKTLRRAFRAELDDGTAQANALVAQSLFKKALGDGKGAVTAAIWWEKTRAGKKEINGLELTGKDGTPLNPNRVHELSDEELERIARGGGG